MSLQGGAFLCVWNDHDPDQAAEYEAWHTFEHVPERVCAPGFVAGRRYAAYDRPESRYFTLYEVESLDALETPQYRDLQDNPTQWSRRMRVAFRNFLRIPCETVATKGNGCAGAIGALVFGASEGAIADGEPLRLFLDAKLATHEITSYHIGKASHIPAYDVFGMPAGNKDDEIWVTLIEGLSVQGMDAVLEEISTKLPDWLDRVSITRIESSHFLFRIHCSELTDSLLHRRGNTGLDLESFSNLQAD